MSLDTYVALKVGNSLYEVKRYKAGALLETTTVDLVRRARSDFETKRLTIARRYASEGCPKGSAYWFGQDGSINRTKLSDDINSIEEMTTRKHFQAAASAIKAISDPSKRQDMAGLPSWYVFQRQSSRSRTFPCCGWNVVWFYW
jgi:hypothetical protein